MQKITSKANQNLKLVKSVRRGKPEKLILIEGVRLAEEALRSDLRIKKSFFSERFLKKEKNRPVFEKISAITEAYFTSDDVFESFSDTKNSQGIILIGDRPKTSKESIERALVKVKSGRPIVLCLHHIGNPSNLGAIFRVAEAADIYGVVITKKSTDPFSPKANRAAMGSNFRLPIWSGPGLE
ncbi:MAG: hypothetical protein HKN25_07355, partial [Pyrinomonadaceae bacterium]|nr:hypothetical protein [Pyrinomonadaceae bacterium]